MSKKLPILDHPPQTVRVFERWLTEQPRPVQSNVTKAITKQAIAFAR